MLDDGLRVLNGRRPAGALVFACNGRGRGMFGSADHDAEAVVKAIGGAPAAGFFAAGEIGPGRRVFPALVHRDRRRLRVRRREGRGRSRGRSLSSREAARRGRGGRGPGR